jgi:hypothetical protein
MSSLRGLRVPTLRQTVESPSATQLSGGRSEVHQASVGGRPGAAEDRLRAMHSSMCLAVRSNPWWLAWASTCSAT